MRRRISTELRALSGLKAPQARHSLNMGRLLALSAALIAYLCAVVAAVVAQPRT
jgi:predicted component of type VI protein secretion system